MSKFSASDVESTARRVGWAIAPGRAEQIAATAAPRIEAFGRIRDRLTFEDDAAAFAAALIDAMPQEGAGK
jgi:hypothetical protein